MIVDAAIDLVLSASGVTKRYPGVLALDDACISIRTGAVHGLVGKNGAGKSTLMGVLAGLVKPDEGILRICDEEIHPGHVPEMEAAGVVLVPQHANLFGDLSVAENLLIPGLLPTRARALVDWRRTRAATQQALAAVDADIDPGMPVGRLSAGLQRFVMIARALLREPKVLILDEPTESFTEDEVAQLFGLLRDLGRRGVAIVYVSHRLDEVLEVSEQITVMRDGRSIADVRSAETSHDELVELIVGPTAQRELAQAASAPPSPADGSEQPLLRVRNLHADGITDATIDVYAGEVVGLYGPLGCGRSQLLRAIAGLCHRTDDSVTVDGRALPPGDVRAAIERHVIYIPEDRLTEGLFPELTVRENLSIAMHHDVWRARRLPLVSRGKERSRARGLLAEVSFDRGELEQPIATLSGGTQQKVVLARALALDPVLWLMDEPLIGLDIATRQEFFRIIRGQVRVRGAALVVLSDFEDLQALCDRVYAMRAGEVCAEFSAHELSEEQLMRAVSEPGSNKSRSTS